MGDCRAVSGILTHLHDDHTQLTLLVESFAGFTFSMEYHKGRDNAATDALSQVTLKLDAKTMKAILDRITMGMIGRSNAHDPAGVEADEEIHKQVQETAVQARVTHAHANLHLTDWVAM